MNNNAKLWVDTLRSGKFEQTEEALTRLTEEGEVAACCCLGVACELALQAGVDITRLDGAGRGEAAYQWENGSTEMVLPEPVREWLGLQTYEGTYVIPGWGDDVSTSLAEQNDAGATFEQIAEIIEGEPHGLFGPSVYGKV